MPDGATANRHPFLSSATDLQRMLDPKVGLSLPRTTILVSTPNRGSLIRLVPGKREPTPGSLPEIRKPRRVNDFSLQTDRVRNARR